MQYHGYFPWSLLNECILPPSLPLHLGRQMPRQPVDWLAHLYLGPLSISTVASSVVRGGWTGAYCATTGHTWREALPMEECTYMVAIVPQASTASHHASFTPNGYILHAGIDSLRSTSTERLQRSYSRTARNF